MQFTVTPVSESFFAAKSGRFLILKINTVDDLLT